MKSRVVAALLLAIAVTLGFLAYANPLNAWRWAVLAGLCG